jgi:hypothetical protein
VYCFAWRSAWRPSLNLCWLQRGKDLEADALIDATFDGISWSGFGDDRYQDFETECMTGKIVRGKDGLCRAVRPKADAIKAVNGQGAQAAILLRLRVLTELTVEMLSKNSNVVHEPLLADTRLYTARLRTAKHRKAKHYLR